MAKKKYLFTAENFKEAYKMAIEKDDEVWREMAYTRDGVKDVHVKHQDGSEFKIRHCWVRYAKVRQIELLVLYPEHHNPEVFAVDDLESVDIK